MTGLPVASVSHSKTLRQGVLSKATFTVFGVVFFSTGTMCGAGAERASSAIASGWHRYSHFRLFLKSRIAGPVIA